MGQNDARQPESTSERTAARQARAPGIRSRRAFVKETTALAAGVATAGYVRPELRSFGAGVALAVGSTGGSSDNPTYTLDPGTIGFWKNKGYDEKHDDYSVTFTKTTMGGLQYTDEELHEILTSKNKSDASLKLAVQLVAVKLNLAADPDDENYEITVGGVTKTILEVLAESDGLLARYASNGKINGDDGYGITAKHSDYATMVLLASYLDAYNNIGSGNPFEPSSHPHP